MRRVFAVCVLGAVCTGVVTKSSAEDLLTIYNRAINNDPTYMAGVHQHASSSEVYAQSRASLLPSVDLLLSHSETSQDIVSSDNSVFQKGSDTFPTDYYELSLSQSIYSYSNWKQFGKAKEEIKRIDAELDAVEQDLLLRVAERYFAALAVQEDYLSISSEKAAVEQHLKLVQAKRKSGQARKTDVLDAQARYMQTLSRELEIRSNFNDALEMLRETTGEPTSSLQLLGDFYMSLPEPASPEAWFEQAKAMNPEIKVRQFEVSAAEMEVRVQKGGRYPTADLEVTYSNEDKQGTVFGGGSEIDETVFAININVPIYSGGLVSSRIREVTQLYNRAKDELELEYRAVQRQTFSTFDGIMTDMSKVQALQKSVEAYSAAVDAKTLGYESGLANSLTVLDAERDLFFARSELARARYGYLLNSLRLKRAVGVLTLDDLTQVNNYLTGDELRIFVREPAAPVELQKSPL